MFSVRQAGGAHVSHQIDEKLFNSLQNYDKLCKAI